MSTFPGTIDEFPGISIDQFAGNNLQSSIYFLSHVHFDHMVGLFDFTFLERLRDEKLKIYSTEVSTTFLRQRLPDNAKCFEFLPINLPTHLKTADNFQFAVTLLPAGHCPGSVMFLFESNKHKVLYTGDFRLNLAEFKKFKGLYTPQGALKRINKVHLDTTFMQKIYEQFPTREQSLDAICFLISEWLDQSPDNHIHLKTAYYYGAECVLMAIYERFNIPVHVFTRSYETFYRFFPNMDKCITLSENTRIHNNCSGFRKFCSTKSANIRTIDITAKYWTEWREEMQVFEGFANYFRVCFATHASLNEIRDVLGFLKPEQVEANVESNDYGIMEEINDLIADCIEGNSPIKRSPEKKLGIEGQMSSVKYFEIKMAEETLKRSALSDDEEDEEFIKLNAIKMAAEKSKAAKASGCATADFNRFDLSVFD